MNSVIRVRLFHHLSPCLFQDWLGSTAPSQTAAFISAASCLLPSHTPPSHTLPSHTPPSHTPTLSRHGVERAAPAESESVSLPAAAAAAALAIHHSADGLQSREDAGGRRPRLGGAARRTEGGPGRRTAGREARADAVPGHQSWTQRQDSAALQYRRER